jgi:hypothetical protein
MHPVSLLASGLAIAADFSPPPRSNSARFY